MKIALLGYGVEGRSAYNYYSRIYPEAQFYIYDAKPEPKYPVPEQVEFIGNTTDFFDIDADIVVRTPAISPKKISSRGEITSVTKEFFARCPAPIIGVTGTKGKGTTASLIVEILKAAGKKVWLVGNIGVSALDIIDEVRPDDIVVYELSSFQLWDLEKSPHVAVVLMIEPEHLDVHVSEKEYVGAKTRIVKYQTANDTAVFLENNPYSRQIGEASLAHKVPYASDSGVYIKDDAFWYGDRRVCETDALKIPGKHNLDNACAAIAAVWQWVQDKEAIAEGLGRFHGLEHRLKFVREVNGVSYYDDSISTTPGSTIAALKTFSAPKILILGGSSKKADFSQLASELRQSSMRKVILIGAEAGKIEEGLKSVGFSNYEVLKNTTMSSIVQRTYELAEPGDIVILSPACASFDMFKSYQDRGEQFIRAVNELN